MLYGFIISSDKSLSQQIEIVNQFLDRGDGYRITT